MRRNYVLRNKALSSRFRNLSYLGALLAIVLLVTIQTFFIHLSRYTFSVEGIPLLSSLQLFLVGIRESYKQLTPSLLATYIASLNVRGVLFIIPIVFWLELRFPLNPRQKLISRGFTQDLIWSLSMRFLGVTLYSSIAAFAYQLLSNYIENFTLDILLKVPIWVKLTALFLLYDFLFWLAHLILHKVNFLWRFHAIHHSQIELNMFTEDRNHPVDYIFKMLFAFIPMVAMAAVAPGIASILGIVIGSHNYLLHSNVKIDLGILEFLIISPRFHRLHHSCKTEHYDHNFGGFLAIWDYLFGTVYLHDKEYPPTGVDDSSFPLEQQRCSRILHYFFTLVKQNMYPFSRIYRNIFKIDRAANI